MPATDFDISVRELAEFVHQTGDLGGESQFRRTNRAVDGIKGHKRLQQSRGKDYAAEVSVERVFTESGVNLRVLGRVDGLIEGLDPLVEEIKTVESRWSREADPVHFAQLRLYAGILALDKNWTHAELHLTYLDLETEETTIFREEASREKLLAFLDETLKEWFAWLLPYVEWLRQRDESIALAPFPFGKFRAGQRDLAKSVYRSVRDKKVLFVEAPTGMGKTLATLFPTIKSLPLAGEGKVFYVTAKTPGRLAAEEAMERLRKSGLHIRSLSLTAKRKICFTESPVGCDPRICPFTKGYYDRVKPAMRELLEVERLDKEILVQVAQKHQVCPFELSLDVSAWVDVVIGDYNYVFDPTVALQRYFSEGKPRHIVLVDEAHNLVDRGREMYSASLEVDDLTVDKDAPGGKGAGSARTSLARARRALQDVLETPGETVIPARPYHDGAVAYRELPDGLLESLKTAARAIEAYLVAQPPGDQLAPWLEPWFALQRFSRTAELFDDSYRTIAEPADQRLTLFCLDPSKRLAETLSGLRSTVFFSATLSPLDYFVDVLGGTEKTARERYDSPFQADQMTLRIAPLDVSFQGRERTLATVAQTVERHVRRAPGNHLIFCPSLSYLEQLKGKLLALGLDCHAQNPIMNEVERGEYLVKFTEGRNSVGLAVMGGIFSEGIDLPGDQLIGVTVIGVGLPGLSIERDLLVAYYDGKERSGFDYAYRYPGMQRVLQAVGRLIRSEEDRGAALLIDRRFFESRYEALFPPWWHWQREA